ncbi:MAG: hypothetical protein KBS52_01345, partial [Clostridiales bacterium]|nr:hypothetical protein [Candidatus Equinaster intestinalis]
MKKQMKQISRKAISVIMAVALVVSCMTASFSVFAATTTAFSVTAKSPAVPLYVNKAVRTGNLSVEIGGTAKAGNTLTWERTSGISASYDDGGYLVGNSVGITGFTVSDGTYTQNVWVIVNAQGDTNFKLINLDFNNYTFKASDWLEGTAAMNSETAMPTGYSYNHTSGDAKLDEAGLITGKFTKTTGVASKVSVNVGGTTKGALYIPAATAHGGVKAVLYNSPMMKDFYDYTIEANMSNKMAVDGENNMTAAPGILARADANYSAASGGYILSNHKSISFKFRNYGGINIYGIHNTDTTNTSGNYEGITLWRQAPYTFYTVGTKDTYFMCTDKSKVFYPDAKTASTLTNKNVKIELNDIGIKYTYNGNVIFDSINNAANYSAFQMLLGNEADASMVKSDNIKEPVPSAAPYRNMYKQNINRDYDYTNANRGTVGFTNNYGNDLYVYDLKVTPKNIADQANAFPEMLPVTGEYTMSVNTRVALKNIGVTAADTKNDNYEIIDGNLLVFKVPTTNSGKITLGSTT